MRSEIPCNITIVKTVALVSCLAMLQNFCIDEVKRSIERDEDILPLDLEHSMNGPEGYVPMINVKDSNTNVPIPRDILDGSNHVDDCPQGTRQSGQLECIGNN